MVAEKGRVAEKGHLQTNKFFGSLIGVSSTPVGCNLFFSYYFFINSIPKESAKFGGFPPSRISRTIQPISITNRSSCL